jgi:hypothetical protein
MWLGFGWTLKKRPGAEQAVTKYDRDIENGI